MHTTRSTQLVPPAFSGKWQYPRANPTAYKTALRPGALWAWWSGTNESLRRHSGDQGVGGEAGLRGVARTRPALARRFGLARAGSRAASSTSSMRLTNRN
jgi:hypothetical protein